MCACERDTSLPHFLCQSTEGFPRADVGCVDGLEDTYILYTMPSAMHYFHAELRGFFFQPRKRDFQGRENLLLRERQDIYIILLQFVLTVYRPVFKESRGRKRGK